MRKLIVFLSLLAILALIWLGLFSSLSSKLGKETLQPQPTLKIAHLDEKKVFNFVNDYRQTLRLERFVKNEELCRIAKERSVELAKLSILGALDAHKGFLDRYRTYPYKISENIVKADTEKEAFLWWLNSSTHRKAMESNWTYSCISCTNAVCSEIFSSFQQ